MLYRFRTHLIIATIVKLCRKMQSKKYQLFTRCKSYYNDNRYYEKIEFIYIRINIVVVLLL